MKEGNPYPLNEDDNGCIMAQEPAAAVGYTYEETAMPDDVAYAHVSDGVLQVSPDIEAEIYTVDKGEVVSMSEFKTMFSKWL